MVTGAKMQVLQQFCDFQIFPILYIKKSIVKIFLKSQFSNLAWEKVADNKKCGGSDVSKGRKETLDECAKTCLGISAMFTYGATDSGQICQNGNKDCLCYCETSPVVNGECQMVDSTDFNLYRHVHGKEINEPIGTYLLKLNPNIGILFVL